MSVRFVVGRAGTGKTHHCIEAVARRLRESSTHGPRLILLVPEQASLQMERALLSGQLRATWRAEVLSFQRLAFRILEAAGTRRREALTPAARAMVLRAIVGRLAPTLRYYKRVELLGGFLDRLGHTIGELINEAVTLDELRSAGAAADAEAGRSAKLADLADIYEAYVAYLGERWVDPSQYLEIAREALGRCPLYDGALIWIDGFAGFTRQELLLLTRLAGRAAELEITLLVEPASLDSIQTTADIDPASLFARSQRTFLALSEMLGTAGVSIEAPLALVPESPPRFRACPELAKLEAGLAGAGSSGGAGFPPVAVRLLELPDRRVEVEFVVSEVCRLVRQSNGALRYRDVAIITGDLEPYHDLLAAALTERGIPCFIDRRRSPAHHPLVQFVRGALATAAGAFSIDAVRLLLKSGLLGIDDASGDELENYILGHGITGARSWTGDDWSYIKSERIGSVSASRRHEHLRRVNAARRRVLEVVGDLASRAGEVQGGRFWADALGRMLETSAALDQVATMAGAAEASGDVELAEEHRQTAVGVAEFLKDLGEALAEVPLGLEELAAVVDTGLSQLTLGLVPPTVDQLLVGSVERSRHPEIKAAFIIGFNDGVFPLQGGEDPILNDDDRVALGRRRTEIGLTRRQRILEGATLAYVAVTRPSEALAITYAASDNEGRALLSSRFVPRMQEALPGLEVAAPGDPRRERATWPIVTWRDLAGCLAMEMRRRPAAQRDRIEVRRRWNDLYVVARAAPGPRRMMSWVLGSLGYRNEATLSREWIEQLVGEKYTASVSELESYAACPFQRFARYGLRLRERQEAQLCEVDMGTVHHAILEDFLNGCLQRNETFAEVGDVEVLRRLEECTERVGEELGRGGELSRARDVYMLRRSARDLSLVVRGQQKVAGSGRFRPRAAEKKFGFAGDPASLPALEIRTPSGRMVYLRGLIDRVDLAEVGDEMAGVVVDYKRTLDKRLDLGNVYHGLSLQLVGYLLALAERGASLAGRPIMPVGAFYVSLLSKYRTVDHPDDAAEVDGAAGPAPRGLFNGAMIELLDEEAPNSGWSTVYKIFRKQGGGLGFVDKSDAAEARHFAALLERTRRKMGQLADGVLKGDISVSPYRLGEHSPCGWCAMQPVCRFEFGDPGMRHLESLTRLAVFGKLEGGQ